MLSLNHQPSLNQMKTEELNFIYNTWPKIEMGHAEPEMGSKVNILKCFTTFFKGCIGNSLSSIFLTRSVLQNL